MNKPRYRQRRTSLVFIDIGGLYLSEKLLGTSQDSCSTLHSTRVKAAADLGILAPAVSICSLLISVLCDYKGHWCLRNSRLPPTGTRARRCHPSGS